MDKCNKYLKYWEYLKISIPIIISNIIIFPTYISNTKYFDCNCYIVVFDGQIPKDLILGNSPGKFSGIFPRLRIYWEYFIFINIVHIIPYLIKLVVITIQKIRIFVINITEEQKLFGIFKNRLNIFNLKVKSKLTSQFSFIIYEC